jgi:hypothetical protein
MDEKEKEKRNRGNSLGENTVKIEIIKYILSKNDPVSGPEIIKKIKETCNLVDEKNIRVHLKDLQKKHCIEKIPHEPGLGNKWKIEKFETLQMIRKDFSKIQLNKYKKSLDIILKRFGHGIESSRYIHFIIWLFLSYSFFKKCIDTDIETIYSKAQEIYRFEKGFKNELRIKKLSYECNTTYIKGKLNFEMSEETFRKIMEELAKKNDEILEEYAWRVCHCHTEQAKENLRTKFDGNDNIIKTIKRNRSQNPEIYPLKPIPWVESFFEKLKEKVPVLSEISIETILKAPDEYQNMCLKMEKMLSLIRDQNEIFERTYLDLLTEYFLYQDIWNGAASEEEKEYAKNTKTIIEEYYDLRKSRDYTGAVDKLNSGERENISKVLANHKDVFQDLLIYY